MPTYTFGDAYIRGRETAQQNALAIVQMAEQERRNRAMEALQQGLLDLRERLGVRELDIREQGQQPALDANERAQQLFDATFNAQVGAARTGAAQSETELAMLSEKLRRLKEGLPDPNVQAQVGLGYSNLGQRKAEHDFEREQATSPQAQVQQMLQSVLMQTQAFRNLVGQAPTGAFGETKPVMLPEYLQGGGGAGQGQTALETPAEAASKLPPITRERLEAYRSSIGQPGYTQAEYDYLQQVFKAQQAQQ